MFQMIVILRRKPEISKEEFHRHWKDKHGPLFRKFPQIKRYTQYHVTDKCRDDSDKPIDGIAILEFDSREEMQKAWEMMEYKDIRDDELIFLEKSGVGVHVVYVDEIVPIIGNLPAL